MPSLHPPQTVSVESLWCHHGVQDSRLALECTQRNWRSSSVCLLSEIVVFTSCLVQTSNVYGPEILSACFKLLLLAKVFVPPPQVWLLLDIWWSFCVTIFFFFKQPPKVEHAQLFLLLTSKSTRVCALMNVLFFIFFIDVYTFMPSLVTCPNFNVTGVSERWICVFCFLITFLSDEVQACVPSLMCGFFVCLFK